MTKEFVAKFKKKGLVMFFPIFLPMAELSPEEINTFSETVTMFLQMFLMVITIIGIILIAIKLIELIINRLDKRRIKKKREKLIERTRDNYENLIKSGSS